MWTLFSVNKQGLRIYFFFAFDSNSFLLVTCLILNFCIISSVQLSQCILILNMTSYCASLSCRLTTAIFLIRDRWSGIPTILHTLKSIFIRWYWGMHAVVVISVQMYIFSSEMTRSKMKLRLKSASLVLGSMEKHDDNTGYNSWTPV